MGAAEPITSHTTQVMHEARGKMSIKSDCKAGQTCRTWVVGAAVPEGGSGMSHAALSRHC